jgi:acetyltransferase-like isoleucine patch superfamily enzyme
MLKFNSYVPRIFLKINGTRYGRKLKLIGWPFIFRYPKAQVRIGDNVSVNSNFFSNLIGLYQRTIIIARGEGRIEIGDRVGISGATIYAREHITIGDDSLIGANTKIFDNDFHPTDASERLEGRLDTLVTKEVVIGKNVFVGCNCIILKGTHIGDNSVIGAGSVVHGDFPENSVIAGNPARLIRQ